MTVAMLWRIRTADHHVRAFLAFLLTYGVAVTLHAVWDSSTSLLIHVGIAAFGLIVLVAFVLAARRPLRS
jgi:RsiW-degrading membrane proteinase PrsW (M82 family)